MSSRISYTCVQCGFSWFIDTPSKEIVFPCPRCDLAAARAECEVYKADHFAMQKLRNMLAAAGPEDTIDLIGHNQPVEWVLHWWDKSINGFVFTNGDDPEAATKEAAAGGEDDYCIHHNRKQEVENEIRATKEAAVGGEGK